MEMDFSLFMDFEKLKSFKFIRFKISSLRFKIVDFIWEIQKNKSVKICEIRVRNLKIKNNSENLCEKLRDPPCNKDIYESENNISCKTTSKIL